MQQRPLKFQLALDLWSISRFICTSVCNVLTSESCDLKVHFWYAGQGYRSFSYIKVIWSRSRSQEPKVLPMTAYGPGNFTLPRRVSFIRACDLVLFLLACRYTGPYLAKGWGCGFNPLDKLEKLHCKKLCNATCECWRPAALPAAFEIHRCCAPCRAGVVYTLPRTHS